MSLPLKFKKEKQFHIRKLEFQLFIKDEFLEMI